MATQFIFLCPLCFKSFQLPKLLKRCMHSFCSQCIGKYVKALLPTVADDKTIGCPVCKTTFKGPSSIAALKDWVEKLPSDPLLLQCTAVDSSDRPDACEPCKMRSKQSEACKFCTECQEKLCGSCSDIHNSFKGTRTHMVVDIDGAAGSVLGVQILPSCDYHKEKKLEYFCKDHDELICSKCAILEHRVCDLIDVDMASESLSQNSSVDEIRCNFQTLKADVDTVDNAMREDSDLLQKQVHRALQDIEDKRKKVNASFDKYKQKITQEVNQYLQRTKQLNADKVKISTGMENSLTLLNSAVKTETPVQLYLRSKAIKRQVDGCKKHIDNCKSKCSAATIQHKFSSNVTSIISNISAVGTFKLNVTVSADNPEAPRSQMQRDSSNCSLQTEYVKEENVAPLPTISANAKANCAKTSNNVSPWGVSVQDKPTVAMRVQNTNVIAIQLPDGTEPSFGGAAYLYDDRLVLTDMRHCRLILMDKNLEFISMLNLDYRPRKVTVVSKTQVAICFHNCTKILIVKINKTMTISKYIHTTMMSKCVTSNNNKLFMTLYENKVTDTWSLTCINLQNGAEKKLENIQGCWDGGHLSMFNREHKNYILYSSREENALKCYTEEGQEVFSYNLIGPAGVDVDKYGNIFVASIARHKILHLSPKGKLVKTLPTGSLYKPFELRMNTSHDKILVTQYESPEIQIMELFYQ